MTKRLAGYQNYVCRFAVGDKLTDWGVDMRPVDKDAEYPEGFTPVPPEHGPFDDAMQAFAFSQWLNWQLATQGPEA